MDIFAETQRCLRKTGPAAYELVEPHLLYLKPQSAHGYTIAKQNNESYTAGFHQKIIDIMRRHGRQLVKSPRLELVDLGPGEYPDKTEPLIEMAHRSGLPVLYAPVDVSQFYLDKVSEAVRSLAPSAQIYPLKTKFEDLDAAQLSKIGLKSPLVFLGPTYMNFSPDYSANFLKRMMPSESLLIVATELLTPDNTGSRIERQYDGDEFVAFGFGPLENLGCVRHNFEGHIGFNDDRKRIEFVFRCTKDDCPFTERDRIVTAVSYRPTGDDFGADLARNYSRSDIFLSPSGHTALAVCGM